MKASMTTAILLFLTSGALAMDPAPEIEWEKLYGSVFLDVQETDSNDFVVAGRRWYNYARTIFLYSSSGDKLWESSVYPYNHVSFAVIQLESGDFVVTGYGTSDESSSQYSLSIYKVSSDGQALWSKVYELENSSRSYGYSLASLPDGGFAICGEIDPAEGMNQAWILRTDSQGDTLWTREWGWQYNDKAMSILYIDNGLTVLMHGNTPTTPGGPHLVRYDLDGNMLWETDIPVLAGEYGQDMCEAADGGLLILTNMYPVLAHTDYYGNVDWYTNPHNRLTIPYGWSIDTTMDGGIIYGGENRWQPGNSTDGSNGIINRMDYEGSFLWRDYVYNSGCTAIYSVRQLSQGGYIAAGKGSSGQGLLIRYAPELGIESSDASPAVKITSVSPNPFSSSLSINCTMPSPMSASVTVYGLDGRIVDVVETGAFPAGEQVVSWVPSSELASGCYLIRLQTEVGTDVMNCVLLGD